MLLFTALLSLSEALKETYHGEADSGTVTSLVDSRMVEQVDWFNGGTIFVLSGNNALQSRRITTSDASGNVTFAAFSYPMADGDKFILATKHYSRDTLVRVINQSLQEIGPFPSYAILTPSATELEEYDLGDISDVRIVETSGETAEPYDWELYYYWREIDGKLHFPKAPSFETLRLTYAEYHDYITDDDDLVSDAIHPYALTATAAYHAAYGRFIRDENNNPDAMKALEKLKADMDKAQMRHPVIIPQRTPYPAT